MDNDQLNEIGKIADKYSNMLGSLSIATQGIIHSNKKDNIFNDKNKKVLFKNLEESYNRLQEIMSGTDLEEKLDSDLRFLDPDNSELNTWYDSLNKIHKPLKRYDKFHDKRNDDIRKLLSNSGVSELANDFRQKYLKAIKNLRNISKDTSKPKKESLRDQLKDRFPDLEEKHLDYIIANDSLGEMKGGFSGGIILSSDKDVAKQDKKDVNKYLRDIYYKLDLGKYEKFRPKLKDIIELDNSSLAILENTNSKIPAYALTKPKIDPENKLKWNSKEFYIRHNLYLMGLLHKEGTSAVKKDIAKADKIKDHVYETLTGIPHYKAIDIPLEDISNKAFQEFREDTPRNLSKRMGPIINNLLAYMNEGDQSIIDGDWKGNGMNLPNGYKIDPLFCYGKEIIDIANFLSEPQLNLGTKQIKNYLNTYVTLRSQHDSQFAINKDKHQEMMKWFDNARLKELSVYLSCMRKRPLDNPAYHNRRMKFINQTEELLGAGNFQ